MNRKYDFQPLDKPITVRSEETANLSSHGFKSKHDAMEAVQGKIKKGFRLDYCRKASDRDGWEVSVSK